MDSYDFNWIPIGFQQEILFQSDFKKIIIGFRWISMDSIGFQQEFLFQQEFNKISIGFQKESVFQCDFNRNSYFNRSSIGFQQEFLFQQEFNKNSYLNKISIGFQQGFLFQQEFNRISMGFQYDYHMIPVGSIGFQQVFLWILISIGFQQESYGFQLAQYDFNRNSHF